jgi:urea transport system permease protein
MHFIKARHPRSQVVRWTGLMLCVLLAMLCLMSAPARAQTLDKDFVNGLASEDSDKRIDVVDKLGTLGTPEAFKILDALNTGHLQATPDGQVLLVDDNSVAHDPITGAVVALPDGSDTVEINNRLRRHIESALAASRLFSSDTAVRLQAAKEMQASPDPAQRELLQKALASEKNPDVIEPLKMSLASIDLHGSTPQIRMQAARDLSGSSNASLVPVLTAMLAKNPDGSYVEPDADVRSALSDTLGSIQRHLTTLEWAGNVFYGISLASVLLLAALGLAITFGLMGIINMAHGELLMIGAYSTYMVQFIFRRFFPGAIDAYVIAAIPVAFVVAALVGMALERSVIRWLYGRPLETLLATWGISLILQQLVRSIFGAQNVEVGNPSWMSGGVTVFGGLVLAYNRIFIIIFALAVMMLVWALLNRTRLGLFVRAVTQNRRMAACVGVSTGRIDMLTFGLGSGIAGLGGVALSQLGNVGPDLGQSYIVDSFMVVVLGGVGQLAGTAIAALGLGEISKFLEPSFGAVLSKIAILVMIVLFIQKRPSGLFALKGRSID